MVNEDHVRPALRTNDNGRTVTLPEFRNVVRTLNQIVEVDYYLPGCPPTPKLIKAAVGALLEGKLPPRGTLYHHYETDDRGNITRANLIVATQNNAARIAMSVDKAARSLIKKGQVTDGLLNMVEMAFRTYDPCFGCASHALPSKFHRFCP